MKAGGTDLAKLPRGGTAESADREDKGGRFKIHRYAKTWSIDEQDMIDDDRSLLGDVQMEFGKAARRVRPDLVYSELLRNPTLRQDGVAVFAAGHGNDHALPLNAANLKTALTAFKLQRENGVNLNLRPDYIIGPPDLEFSILQLLSQHGGSRRRRRQRDRKRAAEPPAERRLRVPLGKRRHRPGHRHGVRRRPGHLVPRQQPGGNDPRRLPPRLRQGAENPPRPLPIGSFGWKWDVKLDVASPRRTSAGWPVAPADPGRLDTGSGGENRRFSPSHSQPRGRPCTPNQP